MVKAGLVFSEKRGWQQIQRANFDAPRELNGVSGQELLPGARRTVRAASGRITCC